MLQKRTKLHHSKKTFSEKHVPKPLSNAWLRHGSQLIRGMQLAQPPPKKPPLANPAYAHGLQLRNLFEEMRPYNLLWQTVDCV